MFAFGAGPCVGKRQMSKIVVCIDDGIHAVTH